MTKPVPSRRHEPRWPVALTVLAMIVMLSLLPKYIRLLPMWITYVLGTAVPVPSTF